MLICWIDPSGRTYHQSKVLGSLTRFTVTSPGYQYCSNVIMSCHVMSSLVLSFPVLACPVLSCHVMLCGQRFKYIPVSLTPLFWGLKSTLPYPCIPYINPDDLKGIDDPKADDATLTTLMTLTYPNIPYINLARVST